VQRYVAEPGTEIVNEAMRDAQAWFACRAGYVETARAVGLVDARAARAFVAEWPSFGVVEVDQELVEEAADLAVSRDLGSLDALHLASALVLPQADLVFATWDRRLHRAAAGEGLAVLPRGLD
jgi:predicted nucleic acid-binding protein